MSYKRIIPCLDLKEGRVVKGINFVDLKDVGDPAETAKAYCDAGADEIVFLDINATYENREIMFDVMERAAKMVSIPLTVGGGIHTMDDIKRLLDVGADKVSINTAAVKNPQFLAEAAQKFGSKRIVAAIDANLSKKGFFEVLINGGRVGAGIRAEDWAQQVQKLGAGEILLTSMDRDGTKIGFDIELTKLVSESVSIPVVASGGAGSMQDFVDVFQKTKVDAALAASLFHFGIVDIGALKQFLKNQNINVRI